MDNDSKTIKATQELLNTLPLPIHSYIAQCLKSYFKIRKYLPYNFYPTNFLSITFDGFDVKLELSHQGFNRLILLCCANLKQIKKNYHKDYLFTEPKLNFRIENSKNIAELKIGMIEKVIYKQIVKSKKKRKKDVSHWMELP